MSEVTHTVTDDDSHLLEAGPYSLDVGPETYQDLAVLAEAMARIRRDVVAEALVRKSPTMASGKKVTPTFLAWFQSLPERQQCVVAIVVAMSIDIGQAIDARMKHAHPAPRPVQH